MTRDVTSTASTMPGAVTASTRTLLTCGVVAGPLYIVVVVLQLLTRDGFDISRHSASMLSNGDQGWIQITNFVACGLLFVMCAIGLHRVLGRQRVFGPAAGQGSTWGARLIGSFGAGMLGAAAFSADPADGFPPGTPKGLPVTMSWHGAVHVLVAGIAFLALITACFVFTRRFVAAGRTGWAASRRRDRRGLPRHLELDLHPAGITPGQHHLRPCDHASSGMSAAARSAPPPPPLPISDQRSA